MNIVDTSTIGVDLVGEFADRLVTVEMRNRAMNHGIIPQMYDEARRASGGRPISAIAGEMLISNAARGDVVFLSTGAGYPPEMPHGENDGPPGVALVARALYYGFGIVPVFLVEDLHLPPVVASAEAAGVTINDFETARDRGLGGAAIALAHDTNEDEIAAIFEAHQPKALICAERLGPNENGVTSYSTRGIGHPYVLNFGRVLAAAAKAHVPTIGVGDNGNEVGFGKLFEFMSSVHPYGRDRNPTKSGGIPTVAATDILFPCSISNWGCYAIAAVLGYLARNVDLIHTPELEKRILLACLDADGYEARYCSKRFVLDGVDGETSMAVVQILRNMLALNLAAPDRGPAH